jgi:hypothetical protein
MTHFQKKRPKHQMILQKTDRIADPSEGNRKTSPENVELTK